MAAERANGVELARSWFPASLDIKGRVPLPHAYRPLFGNDAAGVDVVGVMEDGRVTVMTQEDYEVVARYVDARTSFGTSDTAHRFFDKDRRWRDEFFMNSIDLSIDGQGRLTLPKKLRDALDMPLEADVVWIFSGSYVQLLRKVDKDAIDCAQRMRAAGKPTHTAAPSDSSAPSGPGRTDTDQG
jgi:DNA-binding transcriptional regulator/RsmH inhibitor MraZ